MPAASSKSDRALGGIVTALIQVAAQGALQVLLAPLILNRAGRETLGAFAIVMQVTSYLTVIDTGFGVALGRFLAQAWPSADVDTRYVSTVYAGRRYYVISSIAMAVVLAGAALVVKRLFQLTGPNGNAASHALLLLAAGLVVRAPFYVYSFALVGAQFLALSNMIGLAALVCRTLLSLGLVWYGGGLMALAAAVVVSDLVSAALAAACFRRRVRLKQTEGCEQEAGNVLKDLWRFGGQYLFAALAAKLYFSTDHIIVGALAGAAVASCYYTTQVPAFFLLTVVWKLTDNLSPGINALYASKAGRRVREMYIEVIRTSATLGIGLAAALACFNESVVASWVGRAQFVDGAMTACLSVFAITQVLGHVSATFLIAAGDVTVLTRTVFASGVINVILSMLLGRRFGISGVMLASAIADLGSVIVVTRVLLRELRLSARSFFRDAILPGAAMNAPFIAVGALALIHGDYWLGKSLLIRLGVFTMLWGPCVWVFGFSRDMKQAASSFARSTVGRALPFFA